MTAHLRTPSDFPIQPVWQGLLEAAPQDKLEPPPIVPAPSSNGAAAHLNGNGNGAHTNGARTNGAAVNGTNGASNRAHSNGAAAKVGKVAYLHPFTRPSAASVPMRTRACCALQGTANSMLPIADAGIVAMRLYPNSALTQPLYILQGRTH